MDARIRREQLLESDPEYFDAMTHASDCTEWIGFLSGDGSPVCYAKGLQSVVRYNAHPVIPRAAGIKEDGTKRLQGATPAPYWPYAGTVLVVCSMAAIYIFHAVIVDLVLRAMALAMLSSVPRLGNWPRKAQHGPGVVLKGACVTHALTWRARPTTALVLYCGEGGGA